MKSILLLSFGLTFLMACSGERSISAAEVPPAVSAAFNSRYPDAQKVEWETEKEHGGLIYEADFYVNNKKIEADFNPDGTFIGEDND